MLVAVISDVVWQAAIAAVLALGLAWIGRQNNKIHKLVNSNYGASLKVGAVALRRIATVSKNKADIAAAEMAEQLLKEHEESQAIADGEVK